LLEHPARDRAELAIPVHLGRDPPELALLLEPADPLTQVHEAHLPRPPLYSRASAGGAPAPRRPAARTPTLSSRASASGGPAPRRPAARTPTLSSRASAGGAPAPRRPAARTPTDGN